MAIGIANSYTAAFKADGRTRQPARLHFRQLLHFSVQVKMGGSIDRKVCVSGAVMFIGIPDLTSNLEYETVNSSQVFFGEYQFQSYSEYQVQVDCIS